MKQILVGRNKQQGVALILAMAVVAVAATAAITLISQQQFTVQRSSNFFARDQALQYSLGAEEWAQLWLQRDAKDNNFDHEGEDWATELPPLPVDGGMIVAKLFDLQGQFNLNNLRTKEGEILPMQLERLRSLFAAADIKVAMADAFADWIDKNSEADGVDGAEDDYYLGLEHPYRTVNSLVASATEVRLLREMTQDDMKKLRNDTQANTDPRLAVTALPVTTSINVNTAPPLVLKALGLDSQTVEGIIEMRTDQPFETIDAFMSQPGVNSSQLDAIGLDVKSRFFLLVVESTIAKARSRLYSVIYRNQEDGKTFIVRRSYGTI